MGEKGYPLRLLWAAFHDAGLDPKTDTDIFSIFLSHEAERDPALLDRWKAYCEYFAKHKGDDDAGQDKTPDK